MHDSGDMAREIIEQLTRREQKLAVVESCTGGQLAAALTAVPGASAVFVGGLVAYANAVKAQVLGVDWSTLDQFGAVSEECARELALCGEVMFRADYTVAITGIAGPDGGTAEKPVGTVYIALSHPGGLDVERLELSGDRGQVQAQAVTRALARLAGMLA